MRKSGKKAYSREIKSSSNPRVKISSYVIYKKMSVYTIHFLYSCLEPLMTMDFDSGKRSSITMRIGRGGGVIGKVLGFGHSGPGSIPD